MRPLAALLLLASCILCWPAQATADTPKIDWQRGLLLASAAVPGDLRAPNRQLARVKAERQARARCKSRLLAAVATVPVAEAGLKSLPPGLEDSLLELGMDRGSDGSVVVRMALPLDLLRPAQAPLAEASAVADASVIFVDARGVALAPQIGLELVDEAHTYQGPTLFYQSEKQARKHALVPKGATLVAVSAFDKGQLRLPKGTLADAPKGRPLVIVLWKEGA